MRYKLAFNALNKNMRVWPLASRKLFCFIIQFHLDDKRVLDQSCGINFENNVDISEYGDSISYLNPLYYHHDTGIAFQ